MTDSLGAAAGSIELDAAKAMAALNQVSSGIRQMGSTQPGNGFGSWIRQNEQHINTLGTSIGAFGAVVLGAFGIATNTTMNFDAQISAVGATAGATEGELALLREEALRLGADTTMGATEAAQAMEIMVKAGAPLEAVLNGGAQAAINLGEATGTNIELAAETTATAVNQFKKFGLTYQDSADIITQASNASALDVNDFALALKTAGPVATALGYDFQDLANVMVVLGDAGIKGETGATAIRNILMGIADPAGAGAEALREFGVEVQNTDGTMKDLTQITTELAGTWDSLTEAQQLQLATSIAGEQGAASFLAIMDAQTDAVENNTEAFAEAEKRQKETGTAAEQAAARMDNLKGSIEQLKGVLETITITFMSRVTPALESVVGGLTSLAEMVLRIPAPLQTLLVAATGIVGVLATLAGGTLLLLPRLLAIKDAFIAIRPTILAARAAMLGFLGPIALVVAAAGAIYLAYRTNFLGFADLINGAVGGIQKFAYNTRVAFDNFRQMENPVSAVLDSLANGLAALDFGRFQGSVDRLVSWLRQGADAIDVFVESFQDLRKAGDPVSALLEAVGMALASIGGDNTPARIAKLSRQFQSAGRQVREFVSRLQSLRIGFEFLTDRGVDPVTAALTSLGRIFPSLERFTAPLLATWERMRQVFESFRNQGLNPVQAGLSTLGALVPALNGYVQQVLASWSSWKDAIVSVKDAFADFFAGDWEGGFSHLSDAAQSAFDAMIEGALAIPILLLDVFSAIPWGTIGGLIQSGASSALSFLASIGGRIWGWITGAIDSVDWSGVGSRILGWIGTAIDTMASLSGELVSKGWELILGLYNGLEQRWPAIQSWLSEIGQKAVAAIPDLALLLLSKGLALLGGLWEGIQKQWDVIAPWLTTIGSMAAAAVPVLYDTLRGKGTQLLSGFYLGVINYWNDTILPWFQSINWDGIKTALVDGFTGALSGAFDLGALSGGLSIDIGQAILDWLTRQINGVSWDTFGETVGKAAARAISLAFTGLAALGSIAIALGAGLVKAVINTDWVSVAGSIAAFLTAAIRGYNDFMTGAFRGLFGGLMEAAREAVSNASEPIREMLNKVIGWINTVIDALNKIPGTSIGNVSPILSDVENKLADMRDRALEASAAFREGAKALKGLADTGGGTGEDQPSGGGGGGGGKGEDPVGPLPAIGGLAGMAAAIRDIGNASTEASVGAGLFRGAIGAVGTVGAPAFAALKAAFDVSVPPIGLGFGTAITWPVSPLAALASIKGGFDTTLPGLRAVTQANFDGAKASAIASSAAMNSGVVASLNAMKSAGTSSVNGLKSAATTAMDGMKSSVNQSVVGTQLAVALQMAAMAAVAKASYNSMRDNASSAMSSMRSVVSAGMSAVVSSVRNGMSAAASAAAGMSGRFYGAGADAIQGLVNGARSRLGALQAVVSAAIAIMASIPALGNSPWPMMIGAGHDALDGLVIGIGDRHRDLRAAIGRTISLFDVSPTLSSSGPGYHEALLSSPVASVSNVTTYNVFTLPTDEWVEVATAARTAPQRTATLMQRARSLQPQGGR